MGGPYNATPEKAQGNSLYRGELFCRDSFLYAFYFSDSAKNPFLHDFRHFLGAKKGASLYIFLRLQGVPINYISVI